MRPSNVSPAAANACVAGDVSLPLIAEIGELPSSINENTLKRSNRVNVRLRKGDIENLESRALQAGMPLHALLAQVIHKYASCGLKEKK